MKFTKKGTLRLSRNDYRVGNFIFSEENDFIKVTDINGSVSHRIWTELVKGQALKMQIEDAKNGNEQARNWLHCYAAVLMNVLCCIPLYHPARDDEPEFDYLGELNALTIRCVNLNKALYGIKDDITDDEDAAILKEQQEFVETCDEIDQKIKEGR